MLWVGQPLGWWVCRRVGSSAHLGRLFSLLMVPSMHSCGIFCLEGNSEWSLNSDEESDFSKVIGISVPGKGPEPRALGPKARGLSTGCCRQCLQCWRLLWVQRYLAFLSPEEEIFVTK